MLGIFKKKIDNLEKVVSRLERERSGCLFCRGTGKRKTDSVIRFGIELAGHTICDCICDGDKTIFDFKNEISVIENLNQSLEHQIPSDYRHCDFEKIDKNLKRFLTDDFLFLWLYGPVGTGKTYAANAMKLQSLMKGVNFMIVKEYEIDYGLIDNMKYQFACVDNVQLVGFDNRKKTLLEYYFRVIDFKRENNAKMMFTSTLSLGEWMTAIKKTDNAMAVELISRMHRKIITVELDGKNWREN